MRQFAPSLIAFAAGIAWLAITSTVLPAGQVSGACTNAAMIARLPEVPEASGLAVSRRHQNLLWTHNDSGQPLLYGVGTDGRLLTRVRVTGATVDDWEDLAIGSCGSTSCLYIADIGDNKAARQQIAIYRVPEPAIGEAATAPADVFYATYPDGPQDAEALFVDAHGTLFIVTKGEGSPVSIYRFPPLKVGETVRLDKVTTLTGEADRSQRVTDADISPSGNWVAMRTLTGLRFYRAGALLNGASEPPITANLAALAEPQGEGVALLENGTVYLAGEARDGVRGGTLARASCKLP